MLYKQESRIFTYQAVLYYQSKGVVIEWVCSFMWETRNAYRFFVVKTYGKRSFGRQWREEFCCETGMLFSLEVTSCSSPPRGPTLTHLVKKFPAFMELECSLPCSQKLVPEALQTAEFSPYFHALFYNMHFNIVVQFTPKYPKLFSS
jgi:hypothetical protein